MLHILHRAAYTTLLVPQSPPAVIFNDLPFFMFVMVSSVFIRWQALHLLQLHGNVGFFSSSFGGEISDLISSLRMVLARRKATIGTSLKTFFKVVSSCKMW